MFIGILKSLGLASLLLAPTSAQFGVNKNKKGGGTFEEMNQLASEKAGGLDGANMMDQLAGMDPNEMMKMMQESMNDPATREYIESLGAGMGDAMKELANMDPETMKKQLQDNLAQMASPDILDSVLQNKDEVLESLLENGLVTPEQVEEFKANPALFEESMSTAFSEMSNILSDPKALDAALEMMSGMANILENPSAAMESISKAFDAELGDDDKIEEARLQLLADPNAAGNPGLAALFENEDMLSVLQDPVKFREQVKKGQEMIKGMGAQGGAGMGEL
jgi:hypothetical protein